MEFIKKNWGLLICIVIFLAGVVYLAIKIAEKNDEFEKSEAKIKEHKAWFQKVNSDGWRVKAADGNRLENVATAQKNKTTAEAHLADIKNELVRKYSFKPEVPRNDADAKDRLGRRLKTLASLVISNKVIWESEYMGGELNTLATQSERINPEDFNAIFRQLEIYDRITRDIVAAGLPEVTHLSFPRKWGVEENGDYTITPVLVGVIGTPEALQKFVNTLTNDERMLCIIRNMEFSLPGNSAEDEFNEIVMGNNQEKEQLSLTSTGKDSSRENGGLRASGSRRSSRKSTQTPAAVSRSSRSSRNSNSMNSPEGMIGGLSGNINEEDLVPEDPKRQDYLVFKSPRMLELRLNLDIIEYVAQEESAE
jgi:hypothetical protein